MSGNAGERQTRLFLYGEDSWRVSPRLSFNYGLRWEIYLPQAVTGPGAGGWLELDSGQTPADDQFLVAGQSGVNRMGDVKTTLLNFSPRIGMTYLVNPSTVIRAGYGRTFDPGYGGAIFGIAATQSPPVSVIATVQEPFTVNSNFSFPEINVCQGGGNCNFSSFHFLSNTFSIQDLYNANNPNPFDFNFSSQLPQLADLYALPRRLRLPTVDGWNLALQHALNRNTYLEISYVGNKGTHVLTDSGSQVPYYDLNQPTLKNFLTSSSSTQNCTFLTVADPYCRTTEVSRQASQPWSAQVRYFGNDSSSHYDSLQLKVRRQFDSGFSLQANYTWSKLVDFANTYYAIDPKVARGIGNFDRAHSFVMTNIWELPIGRGHHLLGDAGPVLDRLVREWSLAAVTAAYSGLPFTPTYSSCADDIGFSPYSPCRPNIVGPAHITGRRQQYFTTTGGQLLQASCLPLADCIVPGKDDEGFDPSTGVPLLGQTIGPWQRPGAGQIGNAGRNPLRGPGFFQVDLAVAKRIPITERVAAQFRADAFNVFNTVNLGNPNPSVDGPTGGQIFSLANGATQRQLQFSLRIEF